MSGEEIKVLRRKLKKARESGKLQEISDCCCNLAAYLSDDEEHEEALKLYKESLTACEALGNKEGIALSNRMIAEECISLGYFDDALKHVTLFLNYAENEGDKVEEQRGLVLKGHVFFTQAEYLMDTKPQESKKVELLLEQSMEAYRKSFAICNTELNDINEKERLQMKARLLQNKSLVLSRQNKFDYAQAHLIRAIKICAKEKLNDTEHLCYLSLGDLFIKKGEPQKALHVYDKALELSHSTQKKRDSIIGKAKTYIFMENYQQAKIILKKAYKLRNDFETKQLLKQVATVIHLENNLCSTSDKKLSERQELFKKLGDVYCSLKIYKKGIKCYLNMLGCAQKANLNSSELIKCYDLLCRAFTKDKQYDKALFYSHQEVETLSKWAPEKACKTYLRIGRLHELNGSDFEEVQFAYTKAKSKAKQFQNCKLQIKCLKDLIRVGLAFNKDEIVQEAEKELQSLNENDSESSCDSGNDTESVSSESEGSDLKDLISDSDVEKEEYDRPKERCKRTKFTIKRNEKGETDLHVAAIKGNYKRVKQLIDQGHPVNVRDTAGWTPLHEACNHGYVDIVEILLDFGADINDKGGPSCDGTTPLHDAATNGQLAVIETLIKRGASTLVLNDLCETPLQCLLAWKKKSALDAEEDAILESIVEALKSPLDSEDIKRHLKMNKILGVKTPTESNLGKSSSVLKGSTKSFGRPQKTSAVSEYKETIELLRRKRQNSGSSEDSSECTRNKRKSGSEEYKEAIEELSYKSKQTKSKDSKLNPKPALIDEREYVDNCIVDDDDDDSEGGGRNEAPEIGEEKEEDEDSYQPRKKMKPLTNDTHKRSLEEELKVKPWLKSIPFDLLEDSFDAPLKENELSVSKINETVSEAKVDITVKIFNENIKIPISQSDLAKLKIDWLIKEVAKHRLILQNSDSFISLKSENYALDETTPLLQLADKKLEVVVTKYKSLPLSERYEKICSMSSQNVTPLGFKHSPHPQVVEILKSSNSRCLNLSNLKLSFLKLIPICAAIEYESFLQTLNFSNNHFGDKGVELIVKIFQKSIIEELNVSGCSVTSSGIYHFSDAINSFNELSRKGLEVLNLSSNPLTDDAIAAIDNISEQLSNLRILNITNCELETTVTPNNSSCLQIIQDNELENPHSS